MTRANRPITVAECRRQASLYEEQARAEELPGMRAALFSVSHDWRELADKIDRLAIVREINSAPMLATLDDELIG